MTRAASSLLLALATALPASAQTTDAAYPTSVGRMYAVSTERAWTDVLQLLKDAGFKMELKDDNGRFLVTQPVPVDKKRFGFALPDALANATRGLIKLHVFVPKFIEPARVYVGSTLTAEVAGQRGTMLVYSLEAFGDWMLARLSAKMGVPAYRIPQQPARRAALAKSLLRSTDDKCLTRIEKGEGPAATAANSMPARKLHEVQVVYPRSGIVNEDESRLTLSVVIGEDGFPWPIGVATGSPTDDFAVTALGSMSLWRFTPLVIEGCPAPMPRATVGISFVLQ